MDNIQATPRNEILGKLADILTQGKSAANQYQVLPQVPLLGGTGLGDLFMGKAPELFDDMSYDGLRAVIRGGNTATGGIGTYGARPAVADAALLGMDVAGIGSGLGGLSKRSATAIYDKLASGGTSLSRREALKKLGAITGSAATAGGTLGAARKLLDNAAVDVAPKVADNVAFQGAKNYKYKTLAEYLGAIKNNAESFLNSKHGYGWQMESADHTFEVNEVLKDILRSDEQLYSSMKAGQAEGFSPQEIEKTLNMFSPQAKAEMKEFKQKSAALDTIYGSQGSNPKEAWLNNIKSDFNLDDFRKNYDIYIDGPY